MLLRRIALVSAMALGLTGLWATAAQAMVPPGGGGCVPSQIVALTKVFNHNEAIELTAKKNGDCGFRSYAHCHPLIGSTYYVYGQPVLQGGTSVSNCGDDLHLYGYSGYEYSSDGLTWHRVATYDSPG